MVPGVSDENATVSGQDEVTLSWTTATEINNIGFRIYRGTDNNFLNSSEIGFVPSVYSDGSGEGHTYTFIDQPDQHDTYTYWLVDIDVSGDLTLHAPVTVDLPRFWMAYLPIISDK